MHAEADYSRMWLYLYEDIVTYGGITVAAALPRAWSTGAT